MVSDIDKSISSADFSESRALLLLVEMEAIGSGVGVDEVGRG
jgi:hypothetical protein